MVNHELDPQVVKLHTKLGKPIPPAEPQLIHGSKVVSGTTPSTSSAPAAPAGPVVKVTAVAPKINFLGLYKYTVIKYRSKTAIFPFPL